MTATAERVCGLAFCMTVPFLFGQAANRGVLLSFGALVQQSAIAFMLKLRPDDVLRSETLERHPPHRLERLLGVRTVAFMITMNQDVFLCEGGEWDSPQGPARGCPPPPPLLWCGVLV